MERLTDRRRGVLLLVVLSLLTLFMMLGATYLVIASRARATARAFANAVSGSQTTPSVATGQALVEEALLRIVRGGVSGTAGMVANTDTLLGDKYGTGTQTGTFVAGATSGSVIISTVITATTPVESLSGRVLTFRLPGLNNASVRILRAEPVASGTTLSGTTATIFIPAGPTVSGVNVSTSAITDAAATVTGTNPHFVINGREFSGSPAAGSTDANEPYDGYDNRNDFLANPLSPTARPSFSGTVGTSGTNLRVDNDGDGALDSGWIDVGLPPIAVASGTVYPRAAILITDLDGRLNLNTHGSRTNLDNPTAFYSGTAFISGSNGLVNVTSATSAVATISLDKYPRGFGVGPAEIDLDAANVFDSAAVVLSGADVLSGDLDNSTQRRPPKIGLAEGRYGGRPQTTGTAFPRPGAPYIDDQVTRLPQAWIAATGTDYFVNPLRFGSPPDLKARTRVFLDDYGQPVFYRPYWSPPGGRPTNVDDETIDDPYEVNLSRLAPRSGGVFNPKARGRQLMSGSSADFAPAGQPAIPDNLYSAGELEGLLRLHDIDSPKLPRRLVALCGNQAGASRLLLTTDSWDSAAMTGAARAAVSQLLTTSSTAAGMTPAAAMAMFAPETIMGHKLDINRPFHNSDASEPNDATGQSERLAFAKHFYALAFAIAGNGGPLHSDPTTAADRARQLAQWAVNVVDFRDDDSVMTGFEFDNDLTDGWTVDGDLATTTDADRGVVWGCERPEVLITETVCWHDRNTDDLSPGSNEALTLNNTAETDFDQAYRPQGAFFFELFSPWQSQAAEYDPSGFKAVRRTVQGGSSSVLRAEPMAPELLAVSEPTGTNALARFDTGATIDLSGTTPTGNFPVWRLVTLRNTATGTTTDPLITTTGSAWRTFYFRPPPISLVRTAGNGDIVSGTSAVAYWPSAATVTVPPQAPVVFGTGTSFKIGGTTQITTVSSTFISMDRLFLAPSGTIPISGTSGLATLTEPAITSGTNAAHDPYAVLHSQTLPPTTVDWPLSGGNVNARPLDDLTYNAAGISQLTGPSGAKTLFQNGRHSNYFTAHLQRLADPRSPWNAKTNPYVTIDSQPVDLVVYNTLSSLTGNSDAGKNCDEPCGDGSPFAALAKDQRRYDDADTADITGASANINVDRGKTEVSGTNDRDIWSARINPAGAGALKLLTISSTTRDATKIDPSGNNKSLTNVPAPVRTGTTNHSLGRLSPRFVGTGSTPTKPFPWLVWNNRPFISAAELALVPKTSAFELPRQHCTNEGAVADLPPGGPFGHLPGLFEPVTTVAGTSTLLPPWVAIAGRDGASGEPTLSAPSIWDAVHVPTPFGGSYQDVPMTASGTAALSPLGLANRPYGQLPLFREPGRINVNTITGTAVWTALVGTGTAGTNVRTWSGASAPFNAPVPTLPAALALVSGTTRFIDTYSQPTRNANANAFFRYQTVNRLTNLVTVRSNVFAVWVTIGYSTNPAANSFEEAGRETGEIRRHCGFFIFDRSIPVGFLPGQDLNVRDAILLRKMLQ
jgi:hypothetical protein